MQPVKRLIPLALVAAAALAGSASPAQSSISINVMVAHAYSPVGLSGGTRPNGDAKPFLGFDVDGDKRILPQEESFWYDGHAVWSGVKFLALIQKRSSGKPCEAPDPRLPCPDAYITPDEVQAVIASFDTNHNGSLSRAEFGRLYTAIFHKPLGQRPVKYTTLMVRFHG